MTGAILFVLMIVYIGNVMGCLVLCETAPEIYRARNFSWAVPFLYIYSVLFTFAHEGFKTGVDFLKTPHRNLCTLCAIASIIEERDES